MKSRITLAALLLLTAPAAPAQITILDAPANQWRESHGTEASDPSAN